MHPKMSVEAICALFGKTRQAYYQRLSYKYEEVAEESIILDLIAEYRSEMGKIGGRKLWHELNPRLPEGIGRCTLPQQGRERFYQNEDAPAFLKDLGFNLFSLANNHAFDWGDEGFKKTKAVLGDASFGAGTYEDAYKPKIVSMNGIKIGFMGLSFAAYTGVFDDVASHSGLGCAYINALRVNHDIVEAKRNVDYLFIVPHDGIEYIDVPLPDTFTYVDDIVEGIVRVMAKAPERRKGEDGLPIPPYAVYNIGGGQPENLLDFVQILQEELLRAGVLPQDYDFEAHKQLVPMQPGDVPVTYADATALERDFGFTPKIKLREGLRKFAEWYKTYY